jgi:hypothetical protein
MEGVTMNASRIMLAVGTALLLSAPAAHAADPCLADAKQTYSEAKAQCREDYQTAKDACLNRDHECVEGCRAGRAECVDATDLEEDLRACRNDLRDAKAACRAAHPEGSAELDQCIDQAQVVAFQCRKRARKAAKPALDACRLGFRSCARACPPAEPVKSGAEVRQCKTDAKTGYVTCRSESREAFQTQKDLCKDRDHGCVEGCRAGRDACRVPVEDELDANVAACNATRDAAIQNCRNLYAEGTPERDACITTAQVDAFQCRDAAREAARPSFAACHDGFQTCAEACPPVS